MTPTALTLDVLKRTLAQFGPARGNGGVGARVRLDLGPLDAALGGGLMRGAIHDLSPQSAWDTGAASGFALAAAIRAGASAQTPLLYVQDRFAQSEAGVPYGPGLIQAGLSLDSLILVTLPHAQDALKAAEEGLRARGFAAVIAELAGNAPILTLTLSRRLALAAEQGGGFGLILQHTDRARASAAFTRWRIASLASPVKTPGGLGASAFQLNLCKNRSGLTGTWASGWDHHDRVFTPLSGAMVQASGDGPDRAQRRARAGEA